MIYPAIMCIKEKFPEYSKKCIKLQNKKPEDKNVLVAECAQKK